MAIDAATLSTSVKTVKLLVQYGGDLITCGNESWKPNKISILKFSITPTMTPFGSSESIETINKTEN